MPFAVLTYPYHHIYTCIHNHLVLATLSLPPSHRMRKYSHTMEGDRHIHNRVTDLERQISMFERMLLTLSGTLDQHFKKYDMVIATQQQQIVDLNAIISTLLNDQFRHSEITREKISSALHGISATSVSISSTINSGPRVTSTNNNSGVALGSALEEQLDKLPRIHSSHLHTNPLDSADVSRIHANSILHSSTSPAIGTSSLVPRKDSFLAAHFINEPSHNALSTVSLPATAPNNNAPGLALIPAITTFASSKSGPGAAAALPGNANILLPYADSSKGNSQGEMTDEEQYGSTSHKRKKNLYVGDFQFLKSPHSVLVLWKEYTEGINGQPSIRELESIYQTGWRRDPAVNKRFSRRKVLYKAIETGLNRGYTLEYIIDLLEDYRIIDRVKNQKRPIGWIFHATNIPDILK